MGWQERLRQMVLAGGVLLAGCGTNEKLGADATGGAAGAGTGGVGGASQTANTGGGPGIGGAGGASTGGNTGSGGFSIPCGNASPDPCICGRPDASSAAAEACSELTACQAAGGIWWSGTGPWGTGGQCKSDGGVPVLDGGPAHAGGGSQD